ncbi:hypothetical protein [Endothiovibrio diazotrophicus]
MQPDLDTLRELWHGHLGRAYWRAHPRRTLGIYDAPRHRIAQYAVYGATNLLFPIAALALAHGVYDDDNFRALPASAEIARGLDLILYLLLLAGAVLTLTALRLFQVDCCNGDTDRCDPFRCWAMLRAYRWANAKGWIHRVEGKLLFERRRNPERGPPDGVGERRRADVNDR